MTSGISNFIVAEIWRNLKITFAISLQPLFSPRICCSFCSSSGVHGVFVLPFFFVDVSVVGADAVAAMASVGEDAEVKTVGGEFALFEARRFRGFVDTTGVAGVGA